MERECGGCRFCCWTFNVEVPQRRNLRVLYLKPELSHCEHECAKGCDLYDRFHMPVVCHDFICPYLHGEDIHRPDVFRDLLEGLGGNMGNYIPMVPASMDIDEAKELMAQTRTILAGILIEGKWLKTVLPLDRQPDGSWATDANMHAKWNL